MLLPDEETAATAMNLCQQERDGDPLVLLQALRSGRTDWSDAEVNMLNRLEASLEGDAMRQYEPLQSRDRTLVCQRLLSTLAHDIGGPLNLVLGATSMIELSDDLEAAKAHTPSLRRATKTIASLVRERINALDMPTQPSACDADRLLEQSMRALSTGVSLRRRGQARWKLQCTEAELLTAFVGVWLWLSSRSVGMVTLERGDQSLEQVPAGFAPGDYSLVAWHVPIEDADAALVSQPWSSLLQKDRRPADLALVVLANVARRHHGWVHLEPQKEGGCVLALYLPRAKAD